jgi:hypothetical protein
MSKKAAFIVAGVITSIVMVLVFGVGGGTRSPTGAGQGSGLVAGA